MICTGSATGAYSSVTAKPVPSFALLDIDGSKVGRPASSWCQPGPELGAWDGRAANPSSSLALMGTHAECTLQILQLGPTEHDMEDLACLQLVRLAQEGSTPFVCPAAVQATVYVYQLIDGQVKVDKLEFSKSPSAAGGARQL